MSPEADAAESLDCIADVVQKKPTRVQVKKSKTQAKTSSTGQFVVNTGAAKGGTLAMLNTLGDRQPGWTLHDGKAGSSKDGAQMRGSAFWVVTAEDTARVLELKKPNQRVNRIPGAVDLCRKVAFTELLRKHCADKQAQEESGWYPTSWTFPGEEQSTEFQEALRSGPLILKPDGGHQGDGIYLITSAECLERRRSTLQQAHGETRAIVQRYINEPMLLGGKKFDLRLYVLILSLEPLRVFVCKEALVRCCTIDYEPVSSSNSVSLGMHLTNYAVNKFDPGYQHAANADDESAAQGADTKQESTAISEDIVGNKRTLSSVFKQLETEQNVDTEALWTKLCTMLKEAAGVLASSLNDRAGAGTETPQVAAQRDCFQLFGFDVLLDKDATPHLLEVNDKPAMGYDSVVPCSSDGIEEESDKDGECSAAALRLKAAGRKCKCAAHPRVHVQRPCPVDLAVKTVSLITYRFMVQTF